MNDMLRAVKKKKASDEVVRQLVHLIKQGHVKTGNQLPSERELTEAFKVSRTTLREAIYSLESMGMVETKPGYGTFVLVSGEEILNKTLMASLVTDDDDVLDIFFIRKTIEPVIAQLATGFATSEEIRELEHIVADQEKDLSHGIFDMSCHDTRFHMTLARLARNRVMTQLLQALGNLMAEIREARVLSKARAEISLQGHKRILAAVKNEDCDLARDLMLDHLNEIENSVFSERKGGRKSA
ncbi:MAG: FadR family transcriptional regulator [Deltaproteobacteria bacterium]|nr:FadR family transcriptional regulator [Deltaproteobacteria bacterium]